MLCLQNAFFSFRFYFQYPTTWCGLVKLLDDADLLVIGDKLEKIASDDPDALL